MERESKKPQHQQDDRNGPKHNVKQSFMNNSHLLRLSDAFAKRIKKRELASRGLFTMGSAVQIKY